MLKNITKLHNLFASINEDHVRSVDITIPCIQVEINPDRYTVIDGHHRLVKANNQGFVN